LKLLEDLGMAFVELENGTNEALVVPHVHLFPMDVPKLGHDMETKSLVLVTDMHPNVLSSITVGTEDKGTVMYIGPDSLALPQHLLSAVPVSFLSRLRHDAGEDDEGRPIQILDLCAGSGVQALSMLAAMEQTHPTAKALCVDINARALSFVKFNALLNGFNDDRVQVLQGDLIQLQQAFTTQRSPQIISTTTTTTLSHDAPKEAHQFWHSLKQPHALFPKRCASSHENNARPYDIILANPPFIPVPLDTEGVADGETHTKEADGSVIFQTDDNVRREISRRYGLFSSGGSDGENVLISVIQVASKLLATKEGLLAIVSEYMNPPMPSTPSSDLKDDTNRNRNDVLDVCQKMQYWWEIASSHCSAKGILLTNEFPLSALEYARRRANDASEWHSWEQHLIACNITTISPGLLFVRTEEASGRFDLHHSITPKTDKGSIWTPNNFKAVEFTKQSLSQLWGDGER